MLWSAAAGWPEPSLIHAFSRKPKHAEKETGKNCLCAQCDASRAGDHDAQSRVEIQLTESRSLLLQYGGESSADANRHEDESRHEADFQGHISEELV